MSVDSELAANVEQIDSQIALMGRIIAGAGALAELIGEAPTGQITVRDSLLWPAISPAPTLDPSMGAVEALLASGRLSAISDPELRIALAGMRDLIGDALESQDYAHSITQDQLNPLLDGLSARPSIIQYEEALWLSRRAGNRPTAAEQSLPTSATLPFPTDPVIRSTILRRRLEYIIAIAEISDVRDRLIEIRSLISDEVS